MGIPRLTATLEPYAVGRLLRDVSVVIDGPALAYHLLHVCRANGIRQPSYRLVCRSALAWLDELSRHRVAVQAIYFDGHLPAFKWHVRIERLIKSSVRLARFFSDNPQGCPRNQLASAGQDDAPPVDVFKAGVPDTRPPFADPSFFVPAVIDAIRQEPRYRHLVVLVPGEADAYCASHVLKRGGLVLTSDSDLLAYDLGQGQVVFFRDVHRDDDSAIMCSSFSPSQICQSLGLPPSPGLLRLAYELQHDPHATLSQLVRSCSQPVFDQSEYQTFHQQYNYHDGDALSLPGGGRLPPLNRLDPRISELIVQLKGFPDQTDARVFLPALVENPTRGSAWEPSTPVRQLAYTLLTLGAPEPSTTILEYRRVQSALQKGRKIGTLSVAEAQQFIQEILDIKEWVRQITCGRDTSHWPLVCLAIDISECEKQSKRSHAWHTLRKQHRPSAMTASSIDWDLVHFLAQLQAGFYSLRILCQVLSTIPDSAMEPGLSNVGQLRTELRDFPSLINFPDVDSTRQFLIWFSQNGLALAFSEPFDPSMPSAPKLCGNIRDVESHEEEATSKGRGEKPRKSAFDLGMTNIFSILPAE